MPDAWLSIVDAAAALRCSTRTIERRIAAGRIQCRPTDDGRREVLVAVADPPADDGQVSAAVAAVSQQADRQVQLALGSAQALTQAAQTQVQYQEQEAHRARASARTAWSVVGMMVVVVIIATGWTARTITYWQAQSDNHVRRLTDACADRDALRGELDQARQDLARMEGRLSAAAHQVPVAIAPTTRPSSMMDRLASLLFSE